MYNDGFKTLHKEWLKGNQKGNHTICRYQILYI